VTSVVFPVGATELSVITISQDNPSVCFLFSFSCIARPQTIIMIVFFVFLDIFTNNPRIKINKFVS